MAIMLGVCAISESGSSAKNIRASNNDFFIMSVYFSILNCKDTTIFPIGNEKKQYSARVYHNIIDIPCVVALSFHMPMALFC
jgi:hypothetical protein